MMARAPAMKDLADLPQADCLDEFPHPRQLRNLYGHEDAEEFARGAFVSGRVHHAWLIAGPRGIGKASFAYRIARWFLADDEERKAGTKGLDLDYDSRTAGQIRALSHPRLLLIRRPYDVKTKRHKTSIPVDEVRRLRRFLSHKVEANQWRVIVVDSADELNVNAANALLKSLEEPPPQAIFLLISSEPGRLLPTIRSRCRRLNLSALASDPLRRAALQALQAADKNFADSGLAQLEPFAGGSVRALLTLQVAAGDKLLKEVQALLSALPGIDWLKLHSLADQLAGLAAAQRFETFFDLLFELLHRAVVAGAPAPGADQPQAGDLALIRKLTGAEENSLPAPERLASWASLWETMQRLKTQTLVLNLDRKALILDCLARMEKLAAAQRR